MANIKISQLPVYSAATTENTWLVLNTADESETTKIQKENFIAAVYSQAQNVVLYASGWTYNSGTTYYEYTYVEPLILSTETIVDYTPYNDSVYTALTARIQPYVSCIVGEATFYSQYAPANDITGVINIFNQTL